MAPTVLRSGHPPWDNSLGAGGRGPHDNNIITQSYIHQYGVTYKDGAGVFLAHTMGTEVSDCTIRFGNWSGIAMGGILRHEYDGDEPNCCGYDGNGTISWPYTNEDTLILRNHIRDACMRQNDGAGIYTMGSHRNSLLDGNYVEEINHSPFKNYIHMVAGIYFDGGSEGWTVTNNYVREAHHPFWFGAGPGATTSPNACGWGAGSWPVAWVPGTPCTTLPSGFSSWPGLTWSTTNPNWFFEPPNQLGGYKSVQACKGYPGMSDGTLMNFPTYGGGTGQNYKIATAGAGGSAAIASAAGYDNPSWFPTSGERIHETPYCPESAFEYVEVEWPW